MDEAKNMALLFFVDHLMQKGGQRTIHDLSCQFGARGFTEEMRQAVGTTQEGLCEFLGQYPSLFEIEGDQIQLKGFGGTEQASNTHLALIPPSGRQRDFVAEAVQFFVAKLEKFGPEMQVKSLLGHRSQAAPEVRLVSGRHLKEFADFLASQTEHFVVEADRVRLKHMAEPKTRPGELLDDEGRPLVGHRAKLAAIEFMKGVLEENEDMPVPLDTFYRRFCDRFPHQIRQEVATNPKELLQFLKLNRHVFFIRSNRVQLVRNNSRGDEFGSESGRSTTEDGGSERSDASPAENGHGTPVMSGGDEERRKGAAPPSSSTLFPLNRENVHRVKLVQTLKQAQDAVHSLLADLDSGLSPSHTDCPLAGDGDVLFQPFLAVDFKLVSLGYVQEHFVALVAVASPLQIVVFDLAHSEAILTESGLRELLQGDGVLKVMHDVRRTAPVLANRWGMRMGRVFDTQIAHLVIQHDKFSKPLRDLRAISFINLQRVYFPQSLVMSDVPPRKLSQSPNWADRPFSPEMVLAACEECHCLASGLYHLLRSQIPQSVRPLFEELCAEAAATISGSGRGWNETRNGHAEAMAAGERKVTPLMELPMNGIYRPPPSRCRPSGQPSPIIPGLPPINGGYVPPPLRKVSAPASAHQFPRTQHRPAAPQWTWTPPRAETREMGTQTLATGEIGVRKVYYDEEEEGGERGN